MYLVTASTGQTATGTVSPIQVLGLTDGVAVTFTVEAHNSVGYGPASAASNSVTPAAVPPGAPPSVVGAVGTPVAITSTASSIQMTTSAAVAAGDSIVVALATNGNTSITVTDTLGNIYANNAQVEVGVETQAYVYSTHLVVALPIGSTITATFSSARTQCSMQAWDVHGLTGVEDNWAGGIGLSATALACGSISPRYNNSFIFSAWGATSNNSTLTWTPGSGFTAGAYSRAGTGSSSRDLYTEYQVQSVNGHFQGTATLGTAKDYAGVTVVFQGAYQNTPTGSTATPSPVTRTCVTSTDLIGNLMLANPGDTIQLNASTTYSGNFFAANRPGTSGSPITMNGPASAILNGGQTALYYVLHFDLCQYWNLTGGFSLTNGQKGLVLDRSQNMNVNGCQVYGIGDEGVHLRNESSNNTIQHCAIYNTGLLDPGFGEGCYVGSAVSNWGTTADPKERLPLTQVGFPDLSNNNTITNNTITGTTAECCDIKEGTVGTIITNNTFDGTLINGANGADQWVDLKGSGCTISGNVGTNLAAAQQGYATEDPTIPSQFLSGPYVDSYGTQPAVVLGSNNTWISNSSTANPAASGPSINIKYVGGANTGNVVKTSNTETGFAGGVANIGLTT
jgi:parallel beta-helix repeat protein